MFMVLIVRNKQLCIYYLLLRHLPSYNITRHGFCLTMLHLSDDPVCLMFMIVTVFTIVYLW